MGNQKRQHRSCNESHAHNVHPCVPPRSAEDTAAATFYPFGQFCEIDISPPSLEKQPKTAADPSQRGVEYGEIGGLFSPPGARARLRPATRIRTARNPRVWNVSYFLLFSYWFSCLCFVIYCFLFYSLLVYCLILGSRKCSGDSCAAVLESRGLGSAFPYGQFCTSYFPTLRLQSLEGEPPRAATPFRVGGLAAPCRARPGGIARRPVGGGGPVYCGDTMRFTNRL